MAAGDQAVGILDEILAERIRQDQRWGGPVAFLTRYIGRAVSWTFESDRFRESMVKVAAVAVAAVEAYDRRHVQESNPPPGDDGDLL